MEVLEARRKEYAGKFTKQPSLPLIFNENNEIYQFQGTFDGFTVTVSNSEDMCKLYSMGTFGKGSLSRSKPLTIDKTPHQETLQLTLEESHFLLTLNCLQIMHKGSVLPHAKAWTKFCESDIYFMQNYVVYHYFRSKNWILKPGLKFGGDFVAYKNDPSHFHASYVIIIDNLDVNLERLHEKNRRSMRVNYILGLNRLCEATGKELLIAQIIWPQKPTNDLKQFSVQEVLLKRWILNE